MSDQPARETVPAPEGAAASRHVWAIVLIYAAFAALWILLSDKAVAMLFASPVQITQASMIKGWLFVAVTSLLLYGLMKRMVGHMLATSLRERISQMEKLHALQLLHESENSYRMLTEQVPAIIYRAALDDQSKTTYVSPQIATLGYPVEDWLNKPNLWVEVLHPDDREEVLRTLEKSHRDGEDFVAEYRLKTQDGEWRTIHDEARVIRDNEGHGLYIQGVMLDISERKRAEAESYRLTHYDALTGLPNRVLLTDRLGQLLSLSRREKHFGAMVFFNIDRLKTLNDGLGHVAGDTLLKALAERLSHILREDDTLARLSGDDFAVLLYGLDHDLQTAGGHANVVAQKIHAALKQPFNIGENAIIVTASLGVTMFPEIHRDKVEDILRRADTAMHRAKKGGGNQTAFFDADMGKLASQRFKTERELQRAIPERQMRFYLQPQVNAEGRMVGAEALLRWQHPEQGIVSPELFISLAEESDLIIELDTWIFGEVCSLLVQQEKAGCPLRLSVNTSPRNFRRPDFVPWIKDMLAATGADPSRLTLEVTEGLMVENMGELARKMTALAELGIHFSVDDFGTGYSSLAYLKRLPIHELKIDKAFIQDVPVDADDAALVDTILAVARHLRLRVVAEGVETQEQADFLNARADVIHQGYLFGRPEPAEVWMERYRESGMVGGLCADAPLIKNDSTGQ